MEPTHAQWHRIEQVPLTKLSPYPGNARRGKPGLILNSLRRHAQYRSLVARTTPDGQLTILAGNHTMQALQLHGAGPCSHHTTDHPCGICGGETWEPSARCEIITCDDDTARRINLVDNRSSDLGDYDHEALTELLSYLDDDYDGTGYTEEDVAALIATPTEDWGDAFGNIPDGDRQHLTRTYTLSAEQAEIIDRAMTTALQSVDDTDGNRNGTALAVVCDAYNRSHA